MHNQYIYDALPREASMYAANFASETSEKTFDHFFKTDDPPLTNISEMFLECWGVEELSFEMSKKALLSDFWVAKYFRALRARKRVPWNIHTVHTTSTPTCVISMCIAISL